MSGIKRSRSKSSAGDYEVGYGRPPKHTRFAPGQSGNPKGRPKGARNFATDVQDALKAPVRVTGDGKQRKISTQKAVLLRLREKALSGDVRALDRMVQLAQVYNSEEAAVADFLTADDAAVIEVFRARLLSGAAAVDVSDDRQASDDLRSPSAASSTDGHRLDDGSRPTAARRRRKRQRES
jgi:hypothetical protein